MSDPPKPYVLAAEDVRSIALTIERSLDTAGIEVEVVGDGEECLEKIQQRLPDLLVLDLMMPKMHGIDVLKVLRSNPRTQQLPVLVCTSKEFTTEMRQIEELGVVGTIIKPFRCQNFVTDVLGHLENLGSHVTIAPGVDPCPEAAAKLSSDAASEADTDAEGRDEDAPASKAEAKAPADRTSLKSIYKPKLDTSRRNFQLWGTRGSIPVSGARYVRHGGNTSCLSIDLGDDLIILDAGSGIRDLGNEVAGTNKRIHLFITHTHWDHIQGFPFFTPAYLPNSVLTVYGERGFGKDLESVLHGQLDRDYFPVQFEDMHADIRFEYLSDEPIKVGPATITREYVNHPGATVGYRIEVDGKSLVYISDNEFLQGYLGAPHDLKPDDPEITPHQKTLAFASGADILLHEAQYTNDEYPSKVGWGHSCLSNACLFAKIAAPKRWVVIHHDPLHDDDFLDAKLRLTRDILASMDCTIRMDYGYDGMVLQL